MTSAAWLFCSISLLLYGSSFLWTSVQASNTPFLPQSFFFNYNQPSQPVPIPVTTQCESIHLTWGRDVATGPNPTAPYSLQVYTSSFLFPFIIDAGSGLSFNWSVPFAPGTVYQICMFDKNGNSGGCQASYTVIPASSPNQPSCSNVTFPLGPLDVSAVVDNGPLSQYGWVNQCTDISVTPKNGTPPYTFTVAPALHPPYNITSSDGRSMNWTVSLSWASTFFISVVDVVGNSWANGPLHSGNGPTFCLADKPIPLNGPSTGVAVGAGVGGLVVGALAGIASACLFTKHRRRKERHHVVDIGLGSPTAAYFDRPTYGLSSHYRAVPSTASSGQFDSSIGSSNPSSNNTVNRLSRPPPHYQIEPFAVPLEDGTLNPGRRPKSNVVTPASTPEPPAASSSQVYVVHHDGGRPPVTVYHQDGTEVVELPPRYISSDQGNTDSRSKRARVR
ncbi:hypothetical protein L208DRAFT_1326161 [Tricholoma matsutake]|nr:hypothetical protein L208DRAFT_1326161 [Tricholoma matsutake 945]